jgi:tRNA nucleotidyltransferase (CCA-adding enzyme)
LNEALSLLGRVSGDRIRHELNNILIEECSGDILARLHELNLLCTIHPTLGWDDWLYERFRSLPDTIPDPDWEIPDNNDARSWRQLISYTIWLLRNLPERAVAVCDRLKMPVQLRSTVQAASQLWHTMPWLAKATPSELVSNLKDLPALSRYAVYLATENPRQKDILLTYAKSWRHIKPSVTGHELRKLGIPPGPVYRTILSALRNARLDGSVSTDDQEIALLKELIKSPEVRSQDNGSN